MTLARVRGVFTFKNDEGIQEKKGFTCEYEIKTGFEQRKFRWLDSSYDDISSFKNFLSFVNFEEEIKEFVTDFAFNHVGVKTKNKTKTNFQIIKGDK